MSDSTGPTNPSELSGIEFVQAVQPGWQPIPPPTYPDTGLLGVSQLVLTNPVEPTSIITIDELLTSHNIVLQKEAADRVLLNPFLNPTREQYRPALFQWASIGFPDIHVVQSVFLEPPAVCSDGVVRDINAYISYLLGFGMGTVVENIQSLITGICVSYTLDRNTARIHVTRL